MANLANIKPYADFAHRTAPYGGPQNYMMLVAKQAYELGVKQERRNECAIVALALFAVVTVSGLAYKNWSEKKALEATINEAAKKMEECADQQLT